jgi:hypothetical protein
MYLKKQQLCKMNRLAINKFLHKVLFGFFLGKKLNVQTPTLYFFSNVFVATCTVTGK